MPSYLLASANIPIIESLESCAARLSVVLGDPPFPFRESDRFDEVPAREGIRGAAEFVLFGVPEGESSDSYHLSFQCDTSFPISQLSVQLGLSFLKDVPDDKPTNERGFVDVSLELCTYLNDADFAPGEHVAAGD